MPNQHKPESIPLPGRVAEDEQITAEHAFYTGQLEDNIVTVMHRVTPPTEKDPIRSSFETKIGPFVLLDEFKDYTPADTLGYGDKLTFLKPDSATTAFDEKNRRKVIVNNDGKPLIINGTRRKLHHLKEGRAERASKRLEGRNIRFIM